MITELLQDAIRESGTSRYRISRTSGVDQAVLCRFLKGQSSLSFETADRILDALGLEVVIRPRRERKDG
jgi:DNA-binding phage protein